MTTNAVPFSAVSTKVNPAMPHYLEYHFFSDALKPEFFAMLVETLDSIRRLTRFCWVMYGIVMVGFSIAVNVASSHATKIQINKIALIVMVMLMVLHAVAIAWRKILRKNNSLSFELAERYIHLADKARKYLGVDILTQDADWTPRDIDLILLDKATVCAQICAMGDMNNRKEEYRYRKKVHDLTVSYDTATEICEMVTSLERIKESGRDELDRINT